MNDTDKPFVECNQVFPTLSVTSIQTAIDFYTQRLGFSLRFTWGEPISFAGVDLGSITLHLSTERPQALGGTVVNFIVEDANQLYEFHRNNGVEVVVPIDDRPYEIRDYMVRDPFGNYLGFGQYIYNQGEPVKIERVDLKLRIEKRLAALLEDLAAYKGMTLSSCVEETFLHTFERVGDSVASPHTMGTLKHIETLKKKHGIDYDTHASYRFVE